MAYGTDPTNGQQAPVDGATGMLAGMVMRSPIMGGQNMRLPPLRPVPGDDDAINDIYDRLAAGDSNAEAQVRKCFQDVRHASLEGREGLEKGWWQKLLYISGRQWIYYNNRGGWQDKRLARWIPRPVTNVCSETIQTVRSMLSGISVSTRSRPNGPDPMNTLTAKIADDIEPSLEEEHDIKTRFFEADFWAPALGCVWLHPHWDKSNPKNQEFVQALECPECGWRVHPLDIEDKAVDGCVQCGMPAEQFRLAMDGDQPAGKYEIVGAGATDVVSPLEILIPTYFQRWEDVDRIIRLRWRPKSYYEGRPYAQQINYRATPADRSLQMYRALAMMTDLTTAPFAGSSSATSTRIEGAIEAELWIKPCGEYPEGLWCRSVGGQKGDTVIIRDEERGVLPGPLPWRDVKGRPLWPWVYYPYEERGGKIFAVGALDPVIQKQDMINRHDSMVELIMQRMANPIWLEPKGSEVQRFTGEPGLIVRYSIVAGTNVKPERMEGIVPSAPFFQLRDQYFRDFERLTGTQDVLKGATPAGVEAFSALNLLVERSQSRFTSLFQARGRAKREWFMLAIELERVHGPQTRVAATVGPNNTYTFQQFKKQDLRGGINIVVEDGSEAPKTSLGRRAAVQEAKTLGFLNLNDPETVYKGLELLGVSDMAPGLSAHTTAAQTLHHQYEAWVTGGRQGPSPLKVFPWQNHQIHIVQFDIWANSDKVREWAMQDPGIALELMRYRMERLIALANPFGMPIPMAGAMPMPGVGGDPAAAAAAGGPAGPAGPPGPEAGGPAGAAMGPANSDQESGAPDTLPGLAPGGGNMDAPA